MTTDLLKALGSIRPLSTLPVSSLEQLAAFTSLRTIRVGETIFCQGEPSPYCFGILSGEILIQRVPFDLRQSSKVLSVLGPGSLFGESSFFVDTPRAAMASVSQDGQLIVIAGQKLRDWLRQNPSTGTTVVLGTLQHVLGRLDQTSRDLSLVDGMDRLLNGAGTWPERASSALAFLKNSVEDIDAIFLYQRADFPLRYEPMAHASTLSELKTLPADHALLKEMDACRTLRVLHMPDDRNVLTGFPWIPDDFQSVVIFPLLNLADLTGSMQGVLILACRRSKEKLLANKLLSLVGAARQLSEALHTSSLRQSNISV